MLTKLPPELISGILSRVEHRLDLKYLSEVSKRLNELTTPFLYESILITTGRKTNGIVKAHQRAGVLHYTKDIQVANDGSDEYWLDPENPSQMLTKYPSSGWEALPIHEYPDYFEELKALEYESTTGLTSTELEDKKRWIDPEPEARFSKVVRYMELRRRVLSVLIRCQEETLVIRSHGAYGCHIYDTHLFKRLKRLTWEDMGHSFPLVTESEDIQRLRDCLDSVSHQLVYLKLGLKWWEYSFHKPDDEMATISQEIVKASPGPDGKRFHFQNLQHLSLLGFNFEHDAVDIVGDLNPATLNTLTITLCGYAWPNFLDRLNASETPFNLTTVEILSWADPESASHENEDIIRFVNGCQPLQNFYVAVRDQDGALELWQALLRHRDSLKAFVYYTDPSVGTDPDPTPFYVNDVSFSKPHNLDMDTAWNPLRYLNLEFLGLSYDFEYLIPVLAPITGNKYLKVLLIRRIDTWVINGLKAVENPKRRENSQDDGDDAANEDNFLNFDELVRWAFGPQGFSSLQMIGVGDFSDKVKPCENALLCRKSNPECEEVFPGRNYRFVTRDDRIQQELFRKYASAMVACPTKHIEAWSWL
ncbi:hypothetical protein TRV_04308 [Trichophyton verrucosum HKI 0517]|uniref:F-box domain-containing protein n=1 Tax=Trichophyton verrucosum (strain HKI 0517) TaxID=663202 RepID=D4DB09_TRIVH|nr:uncharacterized protein TRV_04308 [Trichophyton verrucosum HKI 0517]EFE40948.1 hypothetical protein TRV_04308 [Trichophyton verrucosum HKI 0517]